MLESMGNEFIPEFSPAIIDEAVGTRSIYYRLSESEIFEYANKKASVDGLKIVDVIPRMVVTGNGFERVDLSMFDKPTKYEMFESPRFKLSCRKDIIRDIETGKVVMVYSTDYKLPTSIPYVVQANNGKATIFVNITDFVDINTYGQYAVTQPRNYNALMAILFAASVAHSIVTSKSALPADFADGLVLMYAAMLERCINSLVHMDLVTRDKVKYLATEFALIQMYGTEIGTKMFYRYKSVYFPKLSKMVTDSIDNQFKLDHFDKLSLFIEELKNLYPSMKGLSMYTVYDKWIRSYGPATAMSIDYIGYHLYTIAMVLLESPLITRSALEPVLEKSRGADMYRRMQAMISS